MSIPISYSGTRRRYAALITVLVTSSILASCAVGPDYRTAAPLLPATWASNKDKATARPPELANWWTKLNDPLLTSLVERAVRGNLSVAAAQARIEEARANLRQEKASLLPAGGGSSAVQRTRPAATAGAGVQASTFTQYQAGFDASWELDLFGGKQRSIEAAKYGLDAAEEEIRNTMLVLIGDVALNYSQVRASQALLGLAHRTAKSQRDTASVTRTKLEAGSATSVDVERAEALAATTAADIPSLEIARAAAVHRLSVLLGLAPSELAVQLSKRAPIPRPKLPLPVGIPADTLLARPDVRMAERQLAQASARIGVAEAARYPSISLTGNIASNALQLSDIAQKSTIAWTIGPTVTVPIFRAGQLKAAADAAWARKDQSAAAYQSSVLTAMEDVENAIVSLSQQRSRNSRLASAAASYRRAADAARTQFEAGGSDYMDLLDAQRALYASESALINSQFAIATAYITLNKALGGGWNGAVPTGAGRSAVSAAAHKSQASITEVRSGAGVGPARR